MKSLVGRLSFILILLWCLPAWAAPTITNVAGTANNGQLLTATGTLFGEKAGGTAPLIWDDFESGNNGELLSAHGWTLANTSQRDDGADFSNEQAYSGSLSARNYVANYPYYNFDTNYKTFTATDEIYFSCQYRYELISGTMLNWKTGRPNSQTPETVGGAPEYNSKVEIRSADKIDQYGYGGNVHVQYGTETDSWYNKYPDVSENEWFRVEGYDKLSDPGGTANGTFWCTSKNLEPSASTAYGGEHGILRENYLTRDATYASEQFVTFLLGLMCGSAQSGSQFKFYNDDVYVDNTQARIELGNADSFYACSTRTLQIPTDTTPDADGWDDTSIQFLLNTTGFTAGQTGYLYVIDSDGNISNGYAVTIGATTTGGDPEPEPSDPYINDCTVSGVSTYIVADGDNINVYGSGFNDQYISLSSDITEVDSASDVTLTATSCAFDTMQRDADTYVVKDYGVGGITDLTVNFSANISASDIGATVRVLAIENTLQAVKSAINVYFNRGDVTNYFILDNVDTTSTSDSYTGVVLGTDYYFTFKRIGTASTLEIFSDSSRQTLLDTLTIACQNTAYRYFYPLKARGSTPPDTEAVTGTCSNYQSEELGGASGEVWLCDDAHMGGSVSESQVIRTWADGNVGITINQGTFADGSTGYLFVKNSESEISNSFPVQFSQAETGGAGAPQATAASGSIRFTGSIQYTVVEN